jgi:hypothetical protein
VGPPKAAPHDHTTPAPVTRKPCDVHPELPACWT